MAPYGVPVRVYIREVNKLDESVMQVLGRTMASELGGSKNVLETMLYWTEIPREDITGFAAANGWTDELTAILADAVYAEL